MSESSVIPIVDTFHFLVDRLMITPESKRLQKEFSHFEHEEENRDKHWLELMEDFAKFENDGSEEPYTVNTYNGEEALSQTLQYTTFQKNKRYFVILQIHGGCDVRGGYTEPYIFEMNDPYELMSNYIIASVHVNPDKQWDSDDAGYSWQYEGPESSTIQGDEVESKENIPRNWDITKDGVLYKPNGSPIDFNRGSEAPQWWEQNPELVAKWAPTLDEKQKQLKRLRA